jgi:hypothetical protein
MLVSKQRGAPAHDVEEGAGVRRAMQAKVAGAQRKATDALGCGRHANAVSHQSPNCGNQERHKRQSRQDSQLWIGVRVPRSFTKARRTCA